MSHKRAVNSCFGGAAINLFDQAVWWKGKSELTIKGGRGHSAIRVNGRSSEPC